MDIVLTILAVIVIFSVLVLVHEYGHFAAAKRAGIKVLEFGIGFPPRLFKKKIGETEYTINAIPFGGFVKLYGEDSSDPAILKDPRSYAHKSPWIRTKVVAAGVFMNFILAIFLLTVGFSFGIEPLIVNQQDLYPYIDQGIVKIAPGVYVDKVDEAQLSSGVQPGDRIVAINDRAITESTQLKIFYEGGAEKDVDLTVQPTQGAEKKVHIPLLQEGKTLGVTLKNNLTVPRVTLLQVKKNSAAEKSGLIKGDTILSINGKEVYDVSTLQDYLVGLNTLQLKVLRNGQVKDISFVQSEANRMIISGINVGSIADKLGMQEGDVLVSVNDAKILDQDDIKKIADARGKPMKMVIQRDGKPLEFSATLKADEILGVVITRGHSYTNDELSFYPDYTITSIMEVGKVKLPVWSAFKQSVSECVRLTGLTFSALGKTFAGIFTSLEVPSDVGGPVQIAYYTHTFVKEGFFALLRFTALLSLSLAAMNVLPIPALDGGRLFFILVEVVTRRRVSAKFESVVHALGFFLLIGMIILITYSDVVKLF